MRLIAIKMLVLVFAGLALGGGGGCLTNRSLVYDPGKPQRPGKYGLFADGAKEPIAIHQLQDGEFFGVEYEEGGLGGTRQRGELVVRPNEDRLVTVRRIAVDGKQQYAWRRMDEREE
jgi:hypothetical protein